MVKSENHIETLMLIEMCVFEKGNKATTKEEAEGGLFKQ